jgi:hypothetical protein
MSPAFAADGQETVTDAGANAAPLVHCDGLAKPPPPPELGVGAGVGVGVGVGPALELADGVGDGVLCVPDGVSSTSAEKP